MHPLVSIIIPCYNAETYISEAITSCLGQTYQRIEVIVINDGSTDSSPDIVKRFGDQIIFIGQTNMGGSAARNTGLRAAHGDFVKFLDADDFLEKDIIEKQVGHIQSLNRDEPVAVYGDLNLVDVSGSFIGMIRQPVIYSNEDGLAQLIDSVIITSAPLYRKSDLLKINGFNESLKSGQEHELNIKLFLSGVRFIHFDEIVFNHRNYYSPNRISSRKWPESDPNFIWKLMDHYECLLVSSSYSLDGKIAVAIASKLASAGRSLVRAGNRTLAKQHFIRATKICPEISFRIGSRFWITKYYMAASKFFGLVATEWIYYTFVQWLSQIKFKR